MVLYKNCKMLMFRKTIFLQMSLYFRQNDR